MIAWYDRAFGPWYLKLYPHRDLSEAERAIGAVASWLPDAGAVLDVGCGPGRHLRILAGAGRAVIGVDRSRALLSEAARRPGLEGRLVRCDMRYLPFAGGRFGAVLSMFTTFGYFESPDAHVRLLAEYARVTRPGGRLVLDYLNAPAVRAGLVPRSVRRVEGYRVEERRSIVSRADDRAVVKDLVILDAEGAEVERFREEVALYDRETLNGLLERSGWRPLASLGDYDGSAWSPAAPRLVTVAERGEAR